jgi:putative flippase GtrA
MKNTPQALRFVAVGVFNTLLDIGLFVVLVAAHMGPFFANLVATSVALGISLVLHSHITFQGTQITKARIRSFVIITLIGLWIVQPIVIQLVGYTLTSATTEAVYSPLWIINTALPKATAILASLCWNYLWYSRMVFRDDDLTSNRVK